MLDNKEKIKIILTILGVCLAIFLSFPSVETVFKTASNEKRILPIYSVDTEEKKIALTFDAAWGASDTDILLSVLDKYKVKATFFLCGYWVEENSEDVKKMYKAGHDIANHGDTHAHVNNLSLEENKKEILGAHEKVKQLLNIEMDLYRPPYGEYNNTVLKAAKEVDYYTVQWDIDSHDWMKKGVDDEINRVLNHKNLRNGSIVLFHNDTEDTPKALGPIIEGLLDKGYKIVPVSELIYRENYYMDHTGRQILK